MLVPTLERVIYASTATPSPPPVQFVADILAASERNNLRDGVTGALLVSGHAFLQILEGPGQSVDRTYARIERDGRHASLRILNRAKIDHRQFGGWGMLGSKTRPVQDIVMDELIAFTALDPLYVIDRMKTLIRDRATL